MNLFKAILVVALIACSGLLTRSLWPKTVTIVPEPRIVTQWDTVKVIDTLWLTKLRRSPGDTIYLERVVMDTDYVAPHNLRGLIGLYVPDSIGDSTLAYGFNLIVEDSTPRTEKWYLQYYTPGPLAGFSLDTFPPRIFFRHPVFKEQKKVCNTLCQAGRYALVAAGTAAFLGVVFALK